MRENSEISNVTFLNYTENQEPSLQFSKFLHQQQRSLKTTKNSSSVTDIPLLDNSEQTISLKFQSKDIRQKIWW